MLTRKLSDRFHDLPIRRKMILSFLAVISFGGIITLFIGMRIEHQTIFSLAQAKVRHDLASAWMVYNEKLISIRDIIHLSTAREFILDTLQTGNTADRAKKLEDIRREFDLDILTVTDVRGRVVLRARRPDVSGDDQSGDPLVRRALLKETAAATQIVSRAELLKEGSDLADRAYFTFIPTAMAAERSEDHEENGMMLKAASPVEDESGTLLGVLYGGVLFNRNYEIGRAHV